jgi:hypothetical protein
MFAGKIILSPEKEISTTQMVPNKYKSPAGLYFLGGV